MEKITGMEAAWQVPPKVLLIYQAVEELIAAGEDINAVKVSAITDRAGIGKGTAYDYFETKEELIACALLYQIRKLTEELRGVLTVQGGLEEQIRFLLDGIERKSEKHQCFLRFVHVLTDNSGYCHLVREKMMQKEFEAYLPLKVYQEFIEQGRERGEIRKDIPVEYEVYTLFSKLMTYLLSISAGGGPEAGRCSLRSYVRRSLLEELREKH